MDKVKNSSGMAYIKIGSLQNGFSIVKFLCLMLHYNNDVSVFYYHVKIFK